MSFNDFIRLFELEREASSKKKELNLPDRVAQGEPVHHDDKLLTSEDQGTATSSRKYIASSPNSGDPFHAMETGGVVLRRNPRRMTLPARLQRRGRELPFLSPIQSEMSPVAVRPPSNDLTGIFLKEHEVTH